MLTTQRANPSNKCPPPSKKVKGELIKSRYSCLAHRENCNSKYILFACHLKVTNVILSGNILIYNMHNVLHFMLHWPDQEMENDTKTSEK